MVLLVIINIEIAASGVSAQTTGFVGFGSPSTVAYGSAEPVYVKVVVFYKDAQPGYVLIVGLFDDEKGGVLMGSATGSADPCSQVAQKAINTTCAVILRSPSGQDNVTFGFNTISNLHALGVWHLRVASGLEDSQGKVVQGSPFSYGFSVQVVNAIAAKTGTTSTVTSTVSLSSSLTRLSSSAQPISSTSTTSSSSSSDGSNNGLVLVVLAGVVILIVFILNRGRKPKNVPKHARPVRTRFLLGSLMAIFRTFRYVRCMFP